MQLTEYYHYKDNSIFLAEEVLGIKDVSFYMGGSCNFNCQYCDRSYVKAQGLQVFDFDENAENFIVKLLKSFQYYQFEFPIISFHGGETLLFIKTIEKIIQKIELLGFEKKITYFIQTNGSLILKNQWFFEKYKDLLYVSISYDFIYQKDNRTDYDIDKVLEFLDFSKINKQLQFVMPTNVANPFSAELIYSILKLYSKYKIQSLNLILLRHIREKNEFKTIIADESINLHKLFSRFIQFFQILYVSGINLAIDGHTLEIEKNYYINHKQIVLAPNGKIYPEYQFIEYKAFDYFIGSWSECILNRSTEQKKINNLLRAKCIDCPQKELCGLQYYYSMFNQDPANSEKCQIFYSLINLSIKHLAKLKKHSNLLEAIGV